MEDQIIIEKLYVHDEEGLILAKDKYGRLLVSVAYNILSNLEDAKECEEDTYLKAWKVIPPYKPSFLKSFLCKLTRQISIDLYRKNKSRGKYNLSSMEEIDYEISSKDNIEDSINEQELSRKINEFVTSLDEEDQIIMIRKYFLFDDSKTICNMLNISENSLNVKAFRIRKKLIRYLEREGYRLEKD